MQEHPWHQFWTRSVDAATGVAGSAESLAAAPLRWWHDSFKASHDWWMWWMTAWAAGTRARDEVPAADAADAHAAPPAADHDAAAWPARRADVQYVVGQTDAATPLTSTVARKLRPGKARDPGEDQG